MNSWDFVGKAGLVALAITLLLVLIARILFQSGDSRVAKIGAAVLGAVGGSRTAQEADRKLRERFSGKA